MTSVGREQTFVCGNTTLFTGDMPQQNAHSGIMGLTLGRSCRNCVVETPNRGDLTLQPHTTAGPRYYAQSHHDSLKHLPRLTPL